MSLLLLFILFFSVENIFSQFSQAGLSGDEFAQCSERAYFSVHGMPWISPGRGALCDSSKAWSPEEEACPLPQPSSGTLGGVFQQSFHPPSGGGHLIRKSSERKEKVGYQVLVGVVHKL